MIQLIEEHPQEVMHRDTLVEVNFMDQTELVLKLAVLWALSHQVLVQKLLRSVAENLWDRFKDGVFDVRLYCQILKLDFTLVFRFNFLIVLDIVF